MVDDVKRREAELKATFRDVTAHEQVIGRTGDSLRAVRGFGGITDEMLAERAAFNLKEHLSKTSAQPGTMDISQMSDQELAALRTAAEIEQAVRQGDK